MTLQVGNCEVGWSLPHVEILRAHEPSGRDGQVDTNNLDQERKNHKDWEYQNI
jgi:hypothetical protein